MAGCTFGHRALLRDWFGWAGFRARGVLARAAMLDAARSIDEASMSGTLLFTSIRLSESILLCFHLQSYLLPSLEKISLLMSDLFTSQVISLNLLKNFLSLILIDLLDTLNCLLPVSSLEALHLTFD